MIPLRLATFLPFLVLTGLCTVKLDLMWYSPTEYRVLGCPPLTVIYILRRILNSPLLPLFDFSLLYCLFTLTESVFSFDLHHLSSACLKNQTGGKDKRNGPGSKDSRFSMLGETWTSLHMSNIALDRNIRTAILLQWY